MVEITIRSVEEDPDAVGGRVLLHHFVGKDEAGRPVDLCAPDADGRSLGFPVPDGQGGFELTCTSGAIGKCIRWGYRPWEEQPGGPPLAALHEACVHMARADYGGDGRASTREGTLIYWCDRFGVHPCGEDVPAAFEAAWGRDGAICVARPRIAENVSLAAAGRTLSPTAASPRPPRDAARTSPCAIPSALLFNGSGE